MSIGGFIQQRQKKQKTNANGRDNNGCQPLDLPNDRDLSIKGEEFEEEKKIPFRPRQIGCVGRVGFGFICNTDKGRQHDEQNKDAQRDDQVLENAVRPEALPAIEFTLVSFVDFLFVFVVHDSLRKLLNLSFVTGKFRRE